ncbi:MAG: hypothetical protein Q7K42_01795, partial [Candidatus Diapherotrites archaeon]|nr:hypothetical protein [Candidatus Diapherotrites archaeon]
LLKSAIELLKIDGELVYSTCTHAPEENEEVVHHLLSKHPEAKLMELQFKNFKIRQGISEWNGKKFSSEIKKCIRVAPQDNDSEAFFLAKIKKTSGKEVVK